MQSSENWIQEILYRGAQNCESSKAELHTPQALLKEALACTELKGC